MLTIQFPYSATVHADARYEERNQLLGRWWRPFHLAVLVVLFLTLVAGKPLSVESLTAASIVFLIGSPLIAAMVFMPEMVRRMDRFVFGRNSKANPDAIETRTFGLDGLSPAPSWPQPIPWPMITKAVESARFFFIYHAGSNVSEYVPKAAMTPAEIDVVRSLLQDAFRSRPSELRLHTAGQPTRAVTEVV